MAGTNFITRTNILNSNYPDDARKRQAWTVETDDFIARVHETDLGTYGMGPVRDKDTGEKQSISGGGYVGVSFRPRSGVLSLGTPHDKMSPKLVAWGLDQLKKDDWFIRLDPWSDEIEGEVRKNLFATAFSRATNNSVGLDSSGGIFAPNYVEDAAESRRDVRRRYESPQKGYEPLRYEVVRDALRWVQREVSAPTGDYAIRRGEKIARDQIHDAARAAIYAYTGDKSTLVDRALSAAETERNKISSNL